MDDGRLRRARRALPLIACALTLVVVASLVYLREGKQSINTGVVNPTPTSIPHLHGTYTTTFDFIDPSHGWGLVLEYSQPGSRFRIFATTDGASRWRRQFGATAPVDSAFGPTNNIYIHFFDLQHGFAYAGDLYRSADGGAHLDLVQRPTGGPVFTFASASRGWALPVGVVQPHLYVTLDGGATWTALDTPPPASFDVEPSGELPWFQFRDDGEGWLGAGLEQPAVYMTPDGGETWNMIPLAAARRGDIYDTSVRVLPGGAVLALVSYRGGIIGGFYSSDRGATWRGVAPPGGQPEWLANASFVDSTHWWVAGTAR
jgi:photosystem II stability/assembly factor-like uncharacterized protein